jgi:hypothetical protein
MEHSGNQLVSGRPSNLSPQDKILIGLDGVFRPSARKQRDDFYAQNRRFVHYTSAEAALRIITTKRLWLRNATAMADYREVQHGFELLRALIRNENRQQSFVGALDACCPGVARNAIDTFFQRQVSVLLDTYIGSVSEHDDAEDQHGRLSMWRAFGGNSARVAMVLRVPFTVEGAERLSCVFAPVSYVPQHEVEKEFDQIIENISQHREFLRSVDPTLVGWAVHGMLVGISTCQKHAGFHEEKEWRIVYSPGFAASALIETSTEVMGGIPQIVHSVPFDVRKLGGMGGLDLSALIDRIIIGPTPYGAPLFQAFHKVLVEAGVQQPNIVVSGIPLRA